MVESRSVGYRDQADAQHRFCAHHPRQIGVRHVLVIESEAHAEGGVDERRALEVVARQIPDDDFPEPQSDFVGWHRRGHDLGPETPGSVLMDALMRPNSL
jgi:hypothetical protein